VEQKRKGKWGGALAVSTGSPEIGVEGRMKNEGEKGETLVRHAHPRRGEKKKKE